MTPTALQALAPAAAAQADAARRCAPGEEAAPFAAVLDGSVQALSGDGEQSERDVLDVTAIEPRQEAGTQAGVLQAAVQAPAAAGDQPRLDALAMMLAAAPAAPTAPASETPLAGAAAAPAMAAAAAGAPALAAQARAAFGDGAVAVSRPLHGQAPAARRSDGDGAWPSARLREAAPADAATHPERAALAARAGAHRREGDAAPAPLRQVASLAAAGEIDRADAANPRPSAATLAAATTLTLAPGTQRATDAAPATIGQAVPLAASDATPAAAQRLSALAERAPLAASPLADPRPGPIAAPDASPAAADLAAPAAAVAASPAPAAPGAVAHLAPAVGSPDWAPALAQQLVRLPGGGAVELHLNPVELGPLQVKLSVVDGQAQVLFVAEHAAVRHALEAALPQLRTSLAENGISLGHANVGSGAGEQRAAHDGGERSAPGSDREARARADEPAAAAGPRRPPSRATRDGAVDTFA